MGLTPAAGLLAATALHLGFQAVVTAVVYPALAEVPSEAWPHAHAAHRRRITVVVAPVYALTGAACLRALVAGPRSAPVGLAVAGSAVAFASTAAVAAPTHGRLGCEGPTPRALARLRGSDAVRLAGAAVAAAAALAAALLEPHPEPHPEAAPGRAGGRRLTAAGRRPAADGAPAPTRRPPGPVPGRSLAGEAGRGVDRDGRARVRVRPGRRNGESDMAQDGTSGVSGTRDGAGDAGRRAAPADATGDLQFDEAWQDAAAEGDARPDRAHDGPGPVFEDPNDR